MSIYSLWFRKRTQPDIHPAVGVSQPPPLRCRFARSRRFCISLKYLISPFIKILLGKASVKMLQGQQGMSSQVVLYENLIHFTDGATRSETEDFFPPSFNSRAEHKDFLTS